MAQGLNVTYALGMEKKPEDWGSRPPNRSKEMTEYLREYTKKMKRLERELNGLNTEVPPDADYE